MFDLLLTNGRVIDSSQGLDQITNVAFSNGKVAAIGESANAEANRTIDLTGQMVTPGLIDLHTHVYWGGTSIGVDPNAISRQSGCTTLVDAGTAGAANMRGFHRHVIQPATPKILSFINVSFAGIYAFSQDVMVGECSDVRLLDANACLLAAQQHADIVVGVKARVGRIAGGNSGIGPLDIAIEIAQELRLPVMAHLDQPPPSRRDVLDRLRPGDILTHCFRPFPNSPINGDGNPFPEITEARERGIIFDIGHGMGSLGFQTSQQMLEHSFLPDTISSDVHALSIDGPAYDLLVTMSKFLAMGMTLEDVIRCTTLAPATAINQPQLGSLKCGSAGDASSLTLEEGDFEFHDACGKSLRGNQHFTPKGTVIDGKWFGARN